MAQLDYGFKVKSAPDCRSFDIWNPSNIQVHQAWILHAGCQKPCGRSAFGGVHPVVPFVGNIEDAIH